MVRLVVVRAVELRRDVERPHELDPRVVVSDRPLERLAAARPSTVPSTTIDDDRTSVNRASNPEILCKAAI